MPRHNASPSIRAAEQIALRRQQARSGLDAAADHGGELGERLGHIGGELAIEADAAVPAGGAVDGQLDAPTRKPRAHRRAQALLDLAVGPRHVDAHVEEAVVDGADLEPVGVAVDLEGGAPESGHRLHAAKLAPRRDVALMRPRAMV